MTGRKIPNHTAERKTAAYFVSVVYRLVNKLSFLQRVVSLEKPQARAVVPTKTETFPQQSLAASAECWLSFSLSALAALWHKTSQSRLFKRTKNAGVVLGNSGKIDSPYQPPCSRGLGGKTYVSECWAMSNNKNTVVEGESKTLY